jgi:DNA-binding NtrC family response regulator
MNTNILVVYVNNSKPEWDKITAYLKGKGYDVRTASTPNGAYKVLRNEPISTVLSDYDLPKGGGLAFLKRIKVMAPHVEVIFLSEKTTLSKAIESMKKGAYDFYEFPVNKRLLLTVIGKAVEKQVLISEKVELERKIKERYGLGNIIGRSKAMQNVFEVASFVAKKNVTVLLTGHTGTGKEMVANAIHYNSPRSTAPFIRANCAALSQGVIESELFGHEKGSFTGAISKRAGRFELAHNGTIFLDEIGDMSLDTQIKLLRVLQEREFERVGGNETIKVDVRVIAATNRNLEKLMDEGRFRKDLFYRLNVVHIELPSLRERKEDLPLLVSHFIKKFNDNKDYRIRGITKDAMQMFLNYQWPGNVRELENAIESAMALARKDVIESKYLPSFLLLSRPQDSEFYQIPQNITLGEMEREIIELALQKYGGNKTRTAKSLDIGLRTLQRKVGKSLNHQAEPL